MQYLEKDSTVQYYTLYFIVLYSTIVQYNNWHTGVGIEWTAKKSYWLEEGGKVGGGREGSSAIGDGGQAATSLNPDIDGPGSSFLLKSMLSTLFF